MKLKIEYVPIDSIRPYERNAKEHTEQQIEQLKRTIERVGFRDPIGVWNNVVVEGHGRLIAATELGMKEVPIIRLDDMTDDERRAYMIAHNKLAMNTGFNNDVLKEELADLNDKFDFTDFGFGDFELSVIMEDWDPEPYDEGVIEQYKDHSEEYLAKKRVIITYTDDDEEAVAERLGVPEISKVVYDISELV